jgi:hypothetical protein
MLTSEQAFQYRKTLLEEIHDLCFHGNGGFTYSEVYSLPIGRRKFHIQKISDYFKKQNEQINKPNTDNQKSDYELFKSRMQGDVFNVKKAR